MNLIILHDNNEQIQEKIFEIKIAWCVDESRYAF